MKKTVRGTDMKDTRYQVRMHQNYTTDSYNLGIRTYQDGMVYQDVPAVIDEIIKAGAGVLLHGDEKVLRAAPPKGRLSKSNPGLHAGSRPTV